MDVESVVTGSLLRQLSRASYGEGIFPQVRRIVFAINRTNYVVDESSRHPDVVHALIVEFVQHIRRMAPATSNVWTMIQFDLEDATPLFKKYSGDLVTQLHQIGTQVKHNTIEPSVFDSSQVTSIRNLVHLDYRSESSCKHLTLLVRRNAPTLQYLRIELPDFMDITELIRDDNGTYVDYPCLHTLEHRVMDDPPDPLPVFEGVTPFPNIRHLIFKTEYPFGDDTPFRGNAATLECLALMLDTLTLEVLDACKMFTPTSHPKLRQVETKFDIANIPGRPDIAAAMMRFALGIAPHASMRWVEDQYNLINDRNFLLNSFSLELARFSSYTSIQVLSLHRTPVQPWDVISLVKSLPLLSDLRTLAPILGYTPTDTTLDTLPDYVRSKYAPMGVRFRCWRLDCKNHCESEENVQCVLPLALV
ncbi:hypothetical protein FBU31_002270, partial [Coemansia sp. 'formosensis']